MSEKCDILNRPSKLYKYYSFNPDLNFKRLSGEIYLASPIEFNDPCDCQREVINNAPLMEANKGNGWVKLKLIELGYNDIEATRISTSLVAGEDTYCEDVHKKQIEKSGILCLTSKYSDTLMWGYYTNNQGFCIEYDVDKMIPALIIGYINKMDYVTTRFLFNERKYYMIPGQRTTLLKKEYIELSNKWFKPIILKNITNKFINEQSKDLNKLNFVRNIFLKRFVAQSIVYNVDPDGSPSDLFFDRKSTKIESKYFRKTQIWENEEEFRIFLSLGGKMAIPLGMNAIKSIHLGCNMSDENVVATAYLLSQLDTKNCTIYKMRRLKNGGLQRKQLFLDDYKDAFISLKKQLSMI